VTFGLYSDAACLPLILVIGSIQGMLLTRYRKWPRPLPGTRSFTDPCTPRVPPARLQTANSDKKNKVSLASRSYRRIAKRVV